METVWHPNDDSMKTSRPDDQNIGLKILSPDIRTSRHSQGLVDDNQSWRIRQRLDVQPFFLPFSEVTRHIRRNLFHGFLCSWNKVESDNSPEDPKKVILRNSQSSVPSETFVVV